MEKRPKPVTCCTICGKVGYQIALTNERCEQMINRERCRGTNQSAIGVNDWKECSACSGTGGTVEICARCDGVGWLFVRGN